MKVKEIKIVALEEVTEEEFAPYGQIMGREKGEPFETLEILKYYSKNADLGADNEKVDGGLLVCNGNAKKIKYLERHPETAENFIPIEGECIFVMAPTDNTKSTPDASAVKAFYLNSKLGVSLHKGTWHWPPIPLKDIVKLILIRKGALNEKMDVTKLEELGIDEVKIIL
jgi:ureidoglycolate lyase